MFMSASFNMCHPNLIFYLCFCAFNNVFKNVSKDRQDPSQDHPLSQMLSRTVNASFFVLLSFKKHNLFFCPLKDTNFLCLSFFTPKIGFRTILCEFVAIL